MEDGKRLTALLDKYDRALIALALLFAITLHVLASYVKYFSWLSPLTANWLSTAALVALSTLILRRALTERRELDAELLASRLADRYTARILRSERVARCVVDFRERLKDFSWLPYLSNAMALDVLVAFHSSWIQENEEALVNILERNGTISFYLPDPENAQVLENSAIRFGSTSPEADPVVVDRVRTAIRDTRRSLVELYTTVGNAESSLRIFFCPVNVSYSAARIDNHYLVLSVFEHYGAARTGPPAVVLDLRASEHLHNQFEKEFSQLAQAARMYGRVEELGKRIQLTTMRGVSPKH